MTEKTMHTVVLDAMGADRGPAEILAGGVEAARRMGESLHVIVVGDENKLKPALARISHPPANLSLHHAASEITMHVAPKESLRVKDSSISVGIRLVKEGKASGFVSPGNTGAVMANALVTLGRIEGVSRPAITSVFPTSTGCPTVVLDVGANADCKPQHLSQFAVMGSVYSSLVFNHASPKVGLLSIGEERSKGNELIFGARELLNNSKINFVGNVEGRDILSGAVEVVVTDGFTGNIILKFAESIQPFLVKAIKRQVETNVFSRFGAILLGPFLRRMKKTFDYAESGGAPLLGINGNVIICHGSSNARAITNAVLVAYEMAAKRLNERIRDELITNHFGSSNESQNKSKDRRDGVVYSSEANDQR